MSFPLLKFIYFLIYHNQLTFYTQILNNHFKIYIYISNQKAHPLIPI